MLFAGGDNIWFLYKDDAHVEVVVQLLEILGGEGRVKFHYVVDRRDFLARLAELKSARVPRPRP